MSAALRLAARRYHLQHAGQLLLAVLGIALGVAVVLATDLANANAAAAFETANRQTLGVATHRIVAAGGSVDSEVYRRLRTELGVGRAAPRSEALVRLPDHHDVLEGGSVRLLGLDPFAEGALRATLATDGAPPEIAALIGVRGSVLLPVTFARELGLTPGSEFRVSLAGQAFPARVAGLLAGDPAATARTNRYLVADLATLHAWRGGGGLQQIDLVLEPEQVAQIEAILPAGTLVLPAGAEDRVTGQMLAAFRTNLTALSLLALTVGMLLIYATLSFAIVRRRPDFATLRALGVEQAGIVRSILAEATALGLVATAFGLLFGALLAEVLVSLVLTTIDDLYFRTTVAQVQWTVWPFLKAAALGVLGTLLAALPPALEAARTPPRSALTRASLEVKARAGAGVLLRVAVPCLALCAALLLLPGESLLQAFAALFFLLAGLAALVPRVTQWLLDGLGARAGGFGISAALAVRGAAAGLSRTAVAVTALCIAVATVIGVGIMIASFRSSVAHWLGQTLQADFYVTTDWSANEAGSSDSRGFSAAELRMLRNIPGVRGISETRSERLLTPAGALSLRASRPGPNGLGEELIDADPAPAYAAVVRGEAVLLSEPLARRLDLARGDSIRIPTPEGPQSLPIAGIYRDYRTNGGQVLVHYDRFVDWFGQRDPRGVGVYLAAAVEPAGVATALDAFAARRAGINIVANADLRGLSLAIFDRTFAVTGVLRLLAGIVAFLGVFSALLALQLERTRETATLRALGFTRGQVAGNALVQTGLLGAVAGLLAIPVGVALAALLVFVINQRSFGWSMDFAVPPGQLLTGLALAVAAALLAGLWPAWRLGRTPLASGLRAR